MEAFVYHPFRINSAPIVRLSRHQRSEILSKASTRPVSPQPFRQTPVTKVVHSTDIAPSAEVAPPNGVGRRRRRLSNPRQLNPRRSAGEPFAGEPFADEQFSSQLTSLQKRARIANKLSAARTKLRRRTGSEPQVQDTVRLAASSDTTLSPDATDWDSIFAARNQITVKWLWLVTAIARKLYRTCTQSFPEMRAALCVNDLVQEGVCGLMHAVERWDPSRGYPFDAFAFYMVKHSIIRAVQNQSRPIRLPVHVLEKLARMRKVREEFEMQNYPVSVDAIAKRCGVSRKAAELYLARSNITVSIDAPVGGGVAHVSNGRGAEPASSSATSLRDFLVDHSVDVAREVERSCTVEAVAQLVTSTDLLELERSVLFLKYGLGDGVERVRAEVSRILDMRVHNVRRAELSALKKLRHTIGNDISAWTELLS